MPGGVRPGTAQILSGKPRPTVREAVMARPRKFSFPAGHWNWPFKACFSHGVRKDEMIVVGGQMDLDPNGNVLQPGDLWTQVDCAMRNVETVLKDLGADLNDVVKLEV